MKVFQAASSGVLLAIALCDGVCAAQSLRFEKVSPHCYMLAGEAGSANCGAIVTESGVIVVNPPAGQQLAAALQALKRVTSRPVRYCVCTDSRHALTGGALTLARQGTLVLTSRDFMEADHSTPPDWSVDPASAAPRLRIAFKKQMRLFPKNLEVRVSSLDNKWHEGGSVTVFVPSEKVLMVGDIFTPGSYPALEDEPGRASALQWLAAMQEVLESVPLLKSAMPQPRSDPDPLPEEPKTLEEQVTVIPSDGPASTLQALKDLLEQSQKLRSDVGRAVSQRRNRESFLNSPAFGPYQDVGNFESFAIRLYDDLTRR